MTKRLAAFGAGVALWEAIVHVSLLISRQRPTLFGIRLTDRLNVVQSLVPAAVALALGRYAFSTAFAGSSATPTTPARGDRDEGVV